MCMMHGHGEQSGGKPPSRWRRWGPVVLVLVAAAVAIFVLKVDALIVGLVGAMLAMHLFVPHGAGHGAGHGQRPALRGGSAAAPQDGSCCGGAVHSKPQPQETQGAALKK